ncbi:HlyD family secretion protein [Pseudoalteromonas sp. T1lg65]|uniref:HlyD family secretion protein n=1 Tax=Pseudoalteromonas sp. T1lg65 TaxID=2077101 RepID=UPI003F7B215D
MFELFRKEAISHQGHKLDGEVCIATHVSFNWILAVIVLVVLLGGSYLFLSDYQRKEVVSGYLRPAQGISKIYAADAGVIDQLFVEEGQLVSKGEVLARVKIDRVLTSGDDLNTSILVELEQQQSLLKDSLKNQSALFEVNKEKLDAQIKSTDFQLQKAEKQLTLLEQRIQISQNRVVDMQALIEKGFASQQDVDILKDNLLALSQQQEDLMSQEVRLRQQLSELHFELTQQPVRHKETLADLHSELSDINRQIRQYQGQQSYHIISQRAGKVTNIQIKPGMVVTQQTPVMTVLPEHSELEAILFVPTRAYGFLEPDQTTRIRFQAFPYQRFGIYEGKISSVSKSILLPKEAQVPVSLVEPVYQIVVKLDSQTVSAYGNEIPLQAGMLLEADVLVDSRSLFEWLFEPLYSIKGSM